MRILMISRHYLPDMGGQVQGPVCRGLVTQGHAVTVFCSYPFYNDISYPHVPSRECIDGVYVHRVHMLPEAKRKRLSRILNYAWFSIRALFFAVRRRRHFDILLFYPTPPILMPVAGCITAACCRLPFIYHCQDIHPEAMVHAGWTRTTQLLYRWCMRLDSFVCRRAKRVVVLSEDMKKTLERRERGGGRIAIINNPLVAAEPIPDANNQNTSTIIPANRFSLLFAGNAGAFQGTDAFIRAAHRVAEIQNIAFIFLGGGTAWQSLKKQAGALIDHSIFFHNYVSPAEASLAIHNADVGLVSLCPGIIQVAFPSKTMAYLQHGCPLLAAVEADSSLARIISGERLGEVVTPGNDAALTESIIHMYNCRNDLRRERGRIRTTCHRLFGEDVILNQWRDMLAELKTECPAT